MKASARRSERATPWTQAKISLNPYSSTVCSNVLTSMVPTGWPSTNTGQVVPGNPSPACAVSSGSIRTGMIGTPRGCSASGNSLLNVISRMIGDYRAPVEAFADVLTA